MSSSQPDPDCPACGGDGWYADHEAECHEHGCVCGGVQVECECVTDHDIRENEVQF